MMTLTKEIGRAIAVKLLRGHVPKIQNIGLGNYIKNPRRTLISGGQRIPEVLLVHINDGNAFRCYAVKDSKANPVTIDDSKAYVIPIDTEVEQATI